MLDLQQDYMRQMSGLWLGMTAAASQAVAGAAAGAAVEGDKRFAAGPWRDDPRFDLLKRSYLGYADMLQKSVDTAAVDDRTRRQLRFAVRQFVDAMSPANFFLTNPEAMKLALETGGASLSEGMSLFFRDLAKGRISMTDEAAFDVGRNIAVTEGR